MSEQTKNNKWREREIGAFWKKKGPTSTYCSGYFFDQNGQKIRLMMFPNSVKKSENAPDFHVYLSEDEVAGAVDPFDLKSEDQASIPDAMDADADAAASARKETGPAPRESPQKQKASKTNQQQSEQYDAEAPEM